MTQKQPLKVLNTRPAPKGIELEQNLKAAGFDVISYCPYSIVTVDTLESERSSINIALGLDEFTDIIITSHFAADHGLDFLMNYWPQWPETRWWSIGAATAQTMSSYNIDAIEPDQSQTANSETLLQSLQQCWVEHEEMNAPDRAPNVLVIAGKHGRGLIQKELDQLRVSTSTLEVYERQKNQLPCPTDAFDAVILTSTEAAEDIIQSHENLIKSDKVCSFICASERIAEVVRNTGATKVVNSGSAKNQILIECLQHTLVATQ